MKVYSAGGPKGPVGPNAMTFAGLRQLKGGRALLGLVQVCREMRPSLVKIDGLVDQFRNASDIRVRYASLLLLDHLLANHSHLKQAPALAPVRSALQKVAEKREKMRYDLLTAMLPKTDLHVHLDGSVRLSTVLDLANRGSISLKQVLADAKSNPAKAAVLKSVPQLKSEPTLEQLSALSQIRGVQPDFLKMLFLGFDFALAVLQTREGLQRAAFELMEDSYREGVMYLSAIIAPCLHQTGTLTYDEIVDATVSGLEEGKKRFGLGWELSLAIYRGVYTKMFPQHPINTMMCAERWSRRFPNQIGIDVVGAEFETPLSAYANVYHRLRQTPVILRAHAGEMPGQAFNITTAASLGIKRVGHGIHLGELSAEEQRRIIDYGMLFEVSPVSNLKCLCVSQDPELNRLGNHQLAGLLDWATLCTDDRTVMMTNNVTQLQQLEADLKLVLFGEGGVSLVPMKLFHNSLRGIGDQLAARQLRAEGQFILQGINGLMELLRDQG